MIVTPGLSKIDIASKIAKAAGPAVIKAFKPVASLWAKSGTEMAFGVVARADVRVAATF